MKQISILEVINNEPIIFISIIVLLIISIILAFTLAYIEIDKEK